MKNHNLYHPKSNTLSDRQRAIVVEAICTLIDSLLDLLIAIDPAPDSASFIGWELPALSAQPPRQADRR
jgi:hypothetical protein